VAVVESLKVLDPKWPIREADRNRAYVAKRKAARRRLSNSNLMIVNQAAINAGLELRR
jgi:hypothetical protein